MSRGWTWGLVGFLIVLALAAFIGGSFGPGSRARVPSSLAGEPEGLLAFRRLLEDSAVPVELVDRPWSQLPADDVPGLMIVATPLSRAVRQDEIAPLERWLRAGGALLVVDDASVVESDDVLSDFLDRLGVRTNPPGTDLDPATLRPARPELVAASGTEAVPAGRDLRRVMAHRHAGIGIDGDAIPLMLSDRGEVVAVEVGLGRGRVVVYQGPLLANDKLLAGDTLRFALRVVEDLRAGGAVRFDEFHHGYGGILVSFEGLHRRALLWAAVQALAATLLYGVSRGVRFGPVRPRPEPSRRSVLEFVYAMASLYRRASARGHVLQSTVQRFVRAARTRWTLDDAESTVAIGEAVASHVGADPGRITEILRQAENAAAKRAIGEKEMWIRARDVARLEREVSGVDRSRP